MSETIELIDTSEAASILRLCRSRVAQLCASGEIPAFRRGRGHWRIDKQKLLQTYQPATEAFAFEKPELDIPDLSVFDRIKQRLKK